jgi:hypothetical protein
VNIIEQVDKWIDDGALVGFAPWPDGDALLFGYFRSRKGKTIVVDEIDPLGRPDGRNKYSLDKITWYDFDPVYIERLKRLAKFRPTLKETPKYLRKKEAIVKALERASLSKEPVRIRLHKDSESHNATIELLDDGWVKVIAYNDLMADPYPTFVRIESVSGVRIGTAREEADLYLLSQNKRRR